MKKDRNKSVAIILHSLCAEGTPVLMLDLARHWKRLGIEVTVVSLYPTPNDMQSEYEIEGFQIQQLNLNPVGYLRYFHIAYASFKLAFFSGVKSFFSLPFGWHSFIAWGAKLGGADRVIAYVGNYPPLSDLNGLKKLKVLISLGSIPTDYLACCSNYVRQGVLEHYDTSMKKVIMIPNGTVVNIVADKALASKATRLPLDRYRIGMVARLEGHKDHASLVSAMAILKQSGAQNIELVFIGDGTLRPDIESQISQLGLEDCVQILGMRRDIPALLGTLDLFVFSTTYQEGQGIALVEAMAAGIPVIASDVGACREVLGGGKYGQLVEPQNPHMLAQSILVFMNQPEIPAGFVSVAKEYVFSEYALQNTGPQYSKVLNLIG